ncbi:MAG: HAD family phosphatase [Gemmataceae bacterium]
MAQGLAAAIWDVDGTLVDTAELHYAAWVELARQIEKPFTRADFAATFGRRNPEIIRGLFDADATEQYVAEIGERKERIYREAALRQGIALLPGVADLLAGLHNRGVRQAVGSSAPQANLEMILDATHTRTYFEAIVAMEDTIRGKPDPDVFLVAANKLGIDPERCVVLEDAVAGVQAAKAARMQCVAVRFVGHHATDVLRAAGADRVVESLTDVDAESLASLWFTKA